MGSKPAIQQKHGYDDIPQSKDLNPSHEQILKNICDDYDVDENTLYRSKRGKKNEPRNVLIYLIRRLRQDTLKEIGRKFNIDKYSSVCSIIERIKKQMRADTAFRKRVDEMTSRAIKSQEQT